MNTKKIHLYKSLYMSYEPNLYFAMMKCFKISLKRFLCFYVFTPFIRLRSIMNTMKTNLYKALYMSYVMIKYQYCDRLCSCY